MESVIQVVRGDNLDCKNKKCVFCSKPAVDLFGVTSGRKYDGVVIKSFNICKEHRDKINALLSGKFDIDEIYLEQYKITRAKKINMRRLPPLRIAETKNRKTYKTCQFTGCENKFWGIAVQKYCTDPRCKELRKIRFAAKGRRKMFDASVSNIIIERKSAGSKLKNNQVLTIRCRAKDINGCRCKETFTILYSKNRKVYPMFCEEHRSAYKRLRYNQRGTDA
jgi:hypothetical protein